MQTAADLLHSSIWAKSLAEAELRQVAAEMIERTVPAGALVARKGEPVDHWIGVIDGLLKL
jgi:CRP/FNR family cyclic AMP-dependent transcriptional regulator